MVHHSAQARLLQSFLPLASSKYCWICAALILSADVTGKLDAAKLQLHAWNNNINAL